MQFESVQFSQLTVVQMQAFSFLNEKEEHEEHSSYDEHNKQLAILQE